MTNDSTSPRDRLWSDAIRTDRIVVIEWLGTDERKTGSELVERLRKWKREKPRIELKQCSIRAEVLAALAEIASHTSPNNVPMIQFEAHGIPGAQGGLSPTADSNEPLSWTELADPLRAINLRSAFQLLVVGAACYGNGFLWLIPEMLPAPMIACVGFGGCVQPSSVLQTMIEFYRGIMIRGENVEVAVEAARREGREPDSERLNMTSMRDILANGIREIVKQNLGRGVWDEKLAPNEPGFNDVDIGTKVAISHVASALLAVDAFPNNVERFRIDVSKMIRDAVAKRDLS